MERKNERLSEDAIILDEFMRQYTRCIMRRKSLERRKQEIRMEFENPLKAVNYNGLVGGGENAGSAALLYRLDEIDTKIEENIQKAIDTLTEIMGIIDFLKDETMPKIVLEHRYIDRSSWERICRAVHISRTPAIRYWKKGLNELLKVPEVKKRLEEYKERRYI